MDQPGPSSSGLGSSNQYQQEEQWLDNEYEMNPQENMSLKHIITPLDDDYIPQSFQSGGMGEYSGIQNELSSGMQFDPEMPCSSKNLPQNSTDPVAQQQQQQPKRKMIPYDVRKLIKDFWPSRKRRYESMTDLEFKQFVRHMELPMARVKKIMKIDDDVKQQMISQDAPLFLSAAAEIFIQEITLKSWSIVEEGRRKTLQKCDIAAALARDEHFDFLIDIVPREEAKKYMMNPLYEAGLVSHNGGMEGEVQYVLADCNTIGNNVYQLDNGQIIQATAIGQPIPISDPNGEIDISQLPPGFQIVQVPTMPNM